MITINLHIVFLLRIPQHQPVIMWANYLQLQVSLSHGSTSARKHSGKWGVKGKNPQMLEICKQNLEMLAIWNKSRKISTCSTGQAMSAERVIEVRFQVHDGSRVNDHQAQSSRKFRTSCHYAWSQAGQRNLSFPASACAHHTPGRSRRKKELALMLYIFQPQETNEVLLNYSNCSPHQN